MKKKQPVLIRGTVLLAASALIVKILSAIYRVPFQNIVGDEGFYVFQQVYPIYGIASVMALEGFPVFLSKLVAEEKNKDRQKIIVKQLVYYTKWVSFIAFIVFFVGAPWFSEWMGDARLSGLIRSTALLFLLVPSLTRYRGYFQGNLLLEKTAYSQVIEQLVRVLIIIGAALLFQKGLLADVYHASGVASMGAFIGGIVAIVWLKRNNRLKQELQLVKITRDNKLMKRLLVEGGLLCLYASLLVVFQLVDSFVMKNALVTSGLAELSAKIIKGAYDRGQPIAQLGLVVSTAMAMAQLPRLTILKMQGDNQVYLKGFKQLIKVMLVIGSAATVGLIMVLPELNNGLFGDTKETLAIAYFMGVVLLVGLIQMFQIFAQTDNRCQDLFVAYFIGLMTKCILTYPLITMMGSIGASLSTLVGLLVLLLWLVIKLYPRNIKQPSFVWKLVFVLLLMCLSIALFRQFILYFGLNLLSSRIVSLLFVMGSVTIGCVVFGSGIIKTKVFTLEEYEWLPIERYLNKIRRH